MAGGLETDAQMSERAARAPRVSPRAGLVERLRQIANECAPEDAIEAALQAIIEDFRATAGAVCGFDQRHSLLRLVSEVGLSDAGCKRLRSIRNGDPTSWEMPLRGVQNRCAYLIEKAGENRYVPPLLEGSSPLRTIACVPLYEGSVPVGSLILLTTGGRAFVESDVTQLVAPAQLVAGMIKNLRRARGQQGAEPSRPTVLTPRIDVAAMIAERDGLQTERADLVAQQTVDQEEIGRLRGLLVNAEAAMAALTIAQAQVQADLAELPGLTQAVSNAAQEQSTLIARVAELEAAHASIAADRDTHAAQVVTLRETLCESRAGQDAATAELAELLQTVQTLRAALSGHEAQTGEQASALDALQTQWRTEAERAAEAAACIELQATEIQALTAANAQRGAELTEAHATIATLTSACERAEAEFAAQAALLAQASAAPTPLPAVEVISLETLTELPPVIESVPPEPPAEVLALRSTTRATVIELPTAAMAAAMDVVVIDSIDRWGSACGQRSVRWMAPDAVSAERCGVADVFRILVNLGAPGALPAMQALRAAGVTTPIWGCVVSPDGERGVVLGPVEHLAPPLDVDAAIEALGPAAAREGRVIAAGTDVDALMSIRQALSRRQAAVSMAWDAKQVADLLSMAQPHALLADLDLPRGDGFAIVAAVAAAKTPPRLVLVGGGADPSRPLTAIARDSGPLLHLQPLATLVTDSVARVEATPQERRALQQLRSARSA